MSKPKTTRDRITSDAEDYATRMVWVNQNPKGEEQLFYEYISATSYQAGANAEAERAQPVIDAFEALLNIMPKGDALRYFHAKEEVIKGRQLLQQWKAGKEIDRPCPHCGKELNRDRNLCCRECGKEVEE